MELLSARNCHLLFQKIEAIKLLGQRRDLSVRDEDFELANEYGIDLKGILGSIKSEKNDVVETLGEVAKGNLEKLFMESLSKRK